MTRLAIFDCDGTLVDSQANICLAMEQAFVATRLDAPDRTAIRRIVGLSLGEAMRVLVPAADPALHDILVAEYRTAAFSMRSQQRTHDEPLYPGIPELLDALAADGWVCGVATGKSDRGLTHVLALHGIAHHFVTLQTADRHPSKPHPAMLAAAIAEAGASARDSVMIGDTSFDMEMARAAGTRAVGVAWGYHAPEELTAAGAHSIADRVADLPRHLEAL